MVNVSQIKLHLERRESDDPWVVLLGNSLRDNKYYYPVILSLFFSVLDNFFFNGPLCGHKQSPEIIFHHTKKEQFSLHFVFFACLIYKGAAYITHTV